MIRAQRDDADNVENLILELCDNPEPPPDWIQLYNAVSPQKNNVEDCLDKARAADPRDKQSPSSSPGPLTEPGVSLRTGVAQEEELSVHLDAEQLEIPMVEKFTKEKVAELENLFPFMNSKWVQEQIAQVLVQPFNGLEELEARFETKVDEIFCESSG